MRLRDEVRARLHDASEAGRDDRGASFVEYAMLLALIVMVCFVAMSVLGQDTSAFFEDTAAKVAATNPN